MLYWRQGLCRGSTKAPQSTNLLIYCMIDPMCPDLQGRMAEMNLWACQFHQLSSSRCRNFKNYTNGWVVPTSGTRQKMKPILQKQRNPGVLNQRGSQKTGGSHRLMDDIRPHQVQVAEVLTILAHSWTGPMERKGNQIGKEAKETRQETNNNIKTLQQPPTCPMKKNSLI